MNGERPLAGKRALVSGASAGIGRASALALAGAGAAVTVLARRSDRLKALVDELRDAGAPAAEALTADLDDLPEARRRVGAHLAEAGAVQVLINNSGGPPSGPILDADPATFLAAFSRHVLAAHELVRLCLPGMRAAGFGRIVNIVSTSVREPIPNLGVSNTVRAAVAGWSKSVSRELPPGITINNVLPGYTDTERLTVLKESLAKSSGRAPEAVEQGWLQSVPEGRLGRAEEIAAAVLFLASPASSFVRGVSLAVDGGRLASI